MDTVKEYIKTYGLIRHQFETFHDFVYNGIQSVIYDEPNIYTSNGKELLFHNIRFEKPYITLNNKKKIPLTPFIAREKNLTYEFHVKVDLKFEDEEHTLILCSIPAMVRSCVCNLYDKTESERLSLGEILGDHGGYFVINGKERIITGQTRKTYNRFVCVKNLEEEFICEIRSSCEETAKSSLIQLKFNTKKTNIDCVIDKINYTISDIFNSLGTLDILEDLLGEEHIFMEEVIYMIRKNVDEEKKVDTSQFLPHMGQCSNLLKSIMLGKMLRKLVLSEMGILKEEDKNNISYKRVDMVGVLCKDLFKMLWKQFIKSLTKEMEKRKIGSVLPIVDIKKKNITKNFYYCFSTGTWGIKKNNYKKMGVSEFAQNKVSALTNLALLRKFNIPVGKKDKNIKIRLIHPSSIFYICPFETPEGTSVGTRLTLSTTSFVSNSSPFVLVKELMASLNLFKDIENIITKEDFNNIKNKTLLLLNGLLIGYIESSEEFIDNINSMRIKNILNRDISIYRNDNLNFIEVWSDSSRFLRPLFDTKKLHLKEKHMSIQELEDLGILVYRDPTELETKYVSMYPDDPNSDYTELHPSCIMGIVAAQIVFSNHTQSPRVCYMSNMIKQAIGILPTFENRTDATVYSLNYVQKPLNTTNLAEAIGTDEFPNGINAIVAVACYTGFNQEDSIILNKGAIDRGLFGASIKRTISTDIKNVSSMEETICIPEVENRLNLDYSKLDSNGIIRKGSQIVKGDVIIGKILKTKTSDGYKIEDKSIVAKTNEEGIVDSIYFYSSIVKVTIIQIKIPIIGDKFCSGMAQKGTCGMILPSEDMPFSSSGMIPDIIINPHCLPSRMTINQLMSSICSKARCISGNEKYGNGSPFQGTDIVEEACKELKNRGFDPDGTEQFYNGMTGEKIKCKIFVGPVHTHRLTHFVDNKIFSSTNTNIKNKLTRQPLNGRSNDGGLRIGEMEKDCLLRHGIIKFSNERMMDLSDKYTMKTCNKCQGYYHITKLSDNTFICNKCKTLDISTVNIPYASKLLIQELESMGLNATMIT